MQLLTPPAVASNRLLEARARVLKALAHPARLALLQALEDGPVCVCDLATLLPQGLPAVSKHLSQMREAGILKSRREGQKVMYELALPCLSRLFGCVDQALLQQPSSLAREDMSPGSEA